MWGVGGGGGGEGGGGGCTSYLMLLLFGETRVIHRFREQRLREREPHPHSVFL